MSTDFTYYTGQSAPVTGIYRSSGHCEHSEERVLVRDMKFPPCLHCNWSVYWTLMKAVQTRWSPTQTSDQPGVVEGRSST